MLPLGARRRLTLENDDRRFSVADGLWIHQQVGLPLVFDHLHFRCHNPEGMSLAEALAACLATWPEGLRPKVHFSSPRTAMVIVEQRDAMSDQVRRRTRMPQPTQHADVVDPFGFADFLRAAWSAGLGDFDVMLEVKAGDLALLRLREDMARFAPDVAQRLM
jgi:UV DNA damage endonuclease